MEISMLCECSYLANLRNECWFGKVVEMKFKGYYESPFWKCFLWQVLWLCEGVFPHFGWLRKVLESWP